MFNVLASSLLIWGFILTIGPALLKLILDFVASIVPVSAVTVEFGTVFVIVVVVIGILYKSSVSGRIYKKYYNDRNLVKGARRTFKRLLTILHIIGIVGVVLVVLNPMWRFFDKVWASCIQGHTKGFQIAWYIGIVCLATAIGMISGAVYERRRKISRYKVSAENYDDVPDDKKPDDYWLDDEEKISDNLEIFLPESAKEKFSNKDNDAN